MNIALHVNNPARTDIRPADPILAALPVEWSGNRKTEVLLHALSVQAKGTDLERLAETLLVAWPHNVRTEDDRRIADEALSELYDASDELAGKWADELWVHHTGNEY